MEQKSPSERVNPFWDGMDLRYTKARFALFQYFFLTRRVRLIEFYKLGAGVDLNRIGGSG